jgi:Helix-turn-helix domain
MSRKPSASVMPSQTTVTPSLPLFLDLKDAARISGISVYKLRILCRRGLLKYRNLEKWMIVTASLEKFANGEKAA